MASSNFNSVKNGMIAMLVPLPSIIFYLSFLNKYEESAGSALWTWCYHHPLLLANLLFFFNVNLLFWLIAQIQSSHWMIDPYWTVIPVMLVHYYSSHPNMGESNRWRSRAATVLTWVWSMRLLHNYLRREKWEVGSREDWRFTEMRKQYGRHWWWASLFSIYLPQQVFLMGLSLPLYIFHSVNNPLTLWDLVAAMVSVTGITVAYIADTQLHNFITGSKKKQGSSPVLEDGLWRYSRHPNYFGEQMWWWGLVISAWGLGHGWWAFVGAFTNTMCLAYVTKLVEERMLSRENRAEAYRRYQSTTSVWLPWFKYTSPLGLKINKVA